MLGLHASGDLSSADAARVQAHLSECATCRAELEGYRGAMTALRGAGITEESLPAEDASYWHDLERRLRGGTQVVQRLSVGGWWSAVPRVALQAAVVLVVAGALVWLGTLDRGSGQKAVQPSPVVLERGRGPIAVLVRPSGAYRQAEAIALPQHGNDLIYSDFGHVVSPDDIRRLKEQILPASAEQVGSSSRF